MLQTLLKPPPRVYSNYSNVKMDPPEEAYIAQDYIDDEVFQSEENSNESRISVEIEKHEHPDIAGDVKDGNSAQDDQYTSNCDYYVKLGWRCHERFLFRLINNL